MKMFLSILQKMLFILLFNFCQFSYSANNCSIYGKVTAEDTGAALENVIVEISYYVDRNFTGNEVKVKKVISGKDGNYLLEGLEQREYVITFIPKHPYCENFEIIPSEFFNKIKFELNEKLWLGGSVSGKIYLKNNGRLSPLSNAKIFLSGPSMSYSTNSGSDGGYFIGSVDPMCSQPSCTASITAYGEISGIAKEIICCFKIEAGKDEKIDIIFDTDIKTGINGYVKSCLDGMPIKGRPLYIKFYYKGLDKSGYPDEYAQMLYDLNGYFSMLNLPSGFYKVSIPSAPDMDVKNECNQPSEVEVFVPEGVMKSVELFINFSSNVYNKKEINDKEKK
jgi:hypothetical protein